MTDQEADHMVQEMDKGTIHPRMVFLAFAELMDNLRSRNLPVQDGDPNNPWPKVGFYCMMRGLYAQAREAYTTWYELQLKAEPTAPGNRAVHKGTSLHQLGVISLQEGRTSFAQRYFLLAMIEDIWGAPGDYRNRPAFWVLRTQFLLGDEDSDRLFQVAQGLQDRRFPEAALLQFQLQTQGRTIRTTEREMFRPNYRLAESLLADCLKEADATRAGRLFEDLIVYLFSAVQGFEVGYFRSWATGGEFEYDVILRNTITSDPVFSEFGPYLLIEAKYWKDPVSVEALHHFMAKIRAHGVRCGVLIAKSGVPEGPENRTILRAYHRDNILVLVLTLEDITAIVEGKANLLVRLLSEFERIRFDLRD